MSTDPANWMNNASRVRMALLSRLGRDNMAGLPGSKKYQEAPADQAQVHMWFGGDQKFRSRYFTVMITLMSDALLTFNDTLPSSADLKLSSPRHRE
ncbi:MAG: hypothetical protein ACR2OX_11695 [Methyloligellaceae bacterium]